MKLNVNYDVVIIGAGPGGMSAAMYLKRAGITPLIIESGAPGGTLNKTHKIENYPGYTDGDGTTLAFRMYSQTQNLDIPFKIEKVIDIKKENDCYDIITNNGSYKAKFILIATGRVPRKLEAKDADKFEGKGISYCATCDGVLYKNKNVAIVGGGNSAMEAASYMSGLANKVFIINRSPVLRADKKEQEEVLKNKNVEVIFDDKINEVIGNETNVTAVKLNSRKKISVSAIFVCIGQDTNAAYYQNLDLETDSFGIMVNNNMKTSADGVYACGDAISKNLYQVVTATSEGAIAATSIIKEIKNKG